jgi:hypothetical protein
MFNLERIPPEVVSQSVDSLLNTLGQAFEAIAQSQQDTDENMAGFRL